MPSKDTLDSKRPCFENLVFYDAGIKWANASDLYYCLLAITFIHNIYTCSQ